MYPRFELFGPAHLGALALLAAAGLGLTVWAQGAGQARRVRALTGMGLVAAVATYVGLEVHHGTLNPWHLLPLHLCDAAILVALYALVTKNRAATELLLFWTATGTLLATVVPAVRYDFPSPRFVTYFLLHGGVIVAAMVLTFGAGLRPRPKAYLRAWALTNLYAGMVAVVDVALGKNYLFLLRKPSVPTLLDHLGPWPVYILVAEVIALGLFFGLQKLCEDGPRGAPHPRPDRHPGAARGGLRASERSRALP